MDGLGWVWAIHTLLNGPKWAIVFLRTQLIYYPLKPTHLTPLVVGWVGFDVLGFWFWLAHSHEGSSRWRCDLVF